MSRSGGRSRRRPRSELQRGLVVTEGKVTECQYVQRLVQETPGTSHVEVMGVGGAPEAVVDEACRQLKRESKRGAPFDWCCVVVDKDQWPNLEQVCARAREHGIHVVVSNLKFEVWLLWHVQELAASLDSVTLDRKASSAGLTEGKNIAHDFPYGNLLDAVKRAFRANPNLENEQPGPDPSSGMPVLIDLLGINR